MQGKSASADSNSRRPRTDGPAPFRHRRALLEKLRLLSMGLDATDSAVLVFDAAGHVLHTNLGFSRLFGWSSAEAHLHDVRELLFAADPPERKRFDEIVDELRRGHSVRSDELVRDRAGHPLWCSVVVNPILGTAGKLGHIVAVLTDITHTKMHEVLQQRVLAALVGEAPLAEVMDLLCREVERIAPEVTASILRVDEEGRMRPLAGPGLPATYSQAIDGAPIGPQAGSCGTAAFHGEPVIVTDIAHDPRWVRYKDLVLPLGFRACWSSPIKSGDGRVVGTFAFYFREARGPDELHQRLVDVSVHLCVLALERESARARIRQLAFYDPLTGLPNRSLVHAYAEQSISRAARRKEQLAVVFVNLDRFKHINDSLGHAAGDAVLRIVTQRLLDQLSEADILGRLSGDEFVIILPHCDGERATDLAECVLAVIARPCEVGEVPLTPSASIGISLFPENGRDIETLLHHADMAMHQAKNGGRGHFRFFSTEMNLLAQERLALESALHDALANGRLELHYQPQLTLQDGLLYGVEALARWSHPELGRIPPSRFIPLAEECGLIGELSQWALTEACRQLADWRCRGFNIPSVSINLSPLNFHNLDLPQAIAHALATHTLVPRDLTVEITEGVLMDSNPTTTRTIGEVQAQGVRLALDDFGTGYSSLGYLQSLPVSELKLDKSFVHDLGGNNANSALTSAVIRIGESLRLTVVAEGVEELTQQQVLKDQGYHVAQGYLYSPPLPPGELEQWLIAHVRAVAPQNDNPALPSAVLRRSST